MLDCKVKHFTLSNGAIGKVVHLHGNFKILQIVQELEEGPELLKCDSLQRDNNETMSFFMKHKVWEMIKCHMKQTAACINTAGKDSATIHTIHNLLPFILWGIL